MVSVFAVRQRLVLAQTEVIEKSNEIVAIPTLLKPPHGTMTSSQVSWKGHDVHPIPLPGSRP